MTSSQRSTSYFTHSKLGFSLSVMRPRHAATYDGGSVVAVPIKEDAKAIALVLAHKKPRPASGLIENFETFCMSELQAVTP